MPEKKDRNIASTKQELLIFKFLVLLGIAAIIYFMDWLLDSEFKGHPALYIVIIVAFSYKTLSYIIEWLLSFHPQITPKPTSNKKWEVDVLTTYVAGEPKEMLRESLLAIKSMTYPHNTFLCDEADDPELKAFCKEHNIIHVTRTKKVNAKAGNINNALNTVAKGEICLILDPDHVVYPGFLDEVLPFFEDEDVGYVQVVQAYYNQYNTVIAKAAAEQTYQFYGPIMMTLNSYGSAPAIGANCTFRRKALDSIGGHAAGLTEDMHTAIKLQAKGWKPVYHPVIVAKGLVPWNYSGFCMQQLKWSRGSFDLLYNVFPKIAKKLSWKQKFTFLSVPFFYLAGLFSLIDFLIPMLALFLGLIPIKVGIADFVIHFAPLFVLRQLIRQFGQRWYYEEHEKGMPILGGVLFKASWWTTLLGFVYSIVNKKVPYIPTPKDFRHESPYKLMIPNIIVITLSVFAIVFGLIRDFNPFYIFMAGLAAVNIGVLAFGNLMADQHFIIKAHSIMEGTFISKGSKTRIFLYKVRHNLYNLIRRVPFIIGILAISGGLFFYNNYKKIIEREKLRDDPILKIGELGQKYYGVEYDQTQYYSQLNASFVKRSFALDSVDQFEIPLFLDSCYSNNLIPFIAFKVDSALYASLGSTGYNEYLSSTFLTLRKHYMPAFLMLERNNHLPKWDSHYSSAFQYAYFQADSFSLTTNIAWVWHTTNVEKDIYIDSNHYFLSWIFIDKKVTISSFMSDLYIKGKNKHPIPLICNWEQVHEVYEEPDQNKMTKLNQFALIDNYELERNQELKFNLAKIFEHEPDSSYVRKKVKHYIKGVAYNTAHDWRDHNVRIPLTKEKLDKDFRKIKEMGANTIRRYAPTFYDYNILRACNANDMRLLYGFWFDPEVDYLKDKEQKTQYKREVLRIVGKFHDNNAITAWNLGNETWSLLKLHYSQPYLSIVRKAYLNFIEELSIEIKKIDQERPVFAAEEHFNLPSSMYSYQKFVPHLDFFAVNSYYVEKIRELDTIAQQYLNGMPYLVSEFGNKGYWSKTWSDFVFDTLAWELSSQEKAKLYAKQWNEFIYPNRNRNIGGIAFCWQDRYEKTATWFGITDIDENKKPAYYALKQCYGQQKLDELSIPEFQILIREEVFEHGYATAWAITKEALKRENYYYKWVIYEDEVFNRIVETDYSKGAYSFKYQIPKNPSKYRIYLYVKDDKGNSVTESRTILEY